MVFPAPRLRPYCYDSSGALPFQGFPYDAHPLSGEPDEDIQEWAPEEYLDAVVSSHGMQAVIRGRSEMEEAEEWLGAWLGEPHEPLTVGRMIRDVQKGLDAGILSLPEHLAESESAVMFLWDVSLSLVPS